MPSQSTRPDEKLMTDKTTANATNATNVANVANVANASTVASAANNANAANSANSASADSQTDAKLNTIDGNVPDANVASTMTADIPPARTSRELRKYEQSGFYPSEGKAFRIWALLGWLSLVVILLAAAAAALNFILLD